MRENDIDFQSNELGCELGEAFAASLRPAIFDRDIAALGPTQLTQSLHKSGGPLTLCGSRARAEQANGRQLSPPCCARAGIGHASAVLPRSATNSRLLIRSPRRRGRERIQES